MAERFTNPVEESAQSGRLNMTDSTRRETLEEVVRRTLTAVSLFAGVECPKCGTTDLTDFATPAWYKKRVVLCGSCDKVSVLEGEK